MHSENSLGQITNVYFFSCASINALLLYFTTPFVHFSWLGSNETLRYQRINIALDCLLGKPSPYPSALYRMSLSRYPQMCLNTRRGRFIWSPTLKATNNLAPFRRRTLDPRQIPYQPQRYVKKDAELESSFWDSGGGRSPPFVSEFSVICKTESII